MKNILILILSAMLFVSPLFAQGKSTDAKSLITAASKKSTLDESVTFLKKNISSISVPAEKRSVYAFLAAVLEQQGLYAEAQKTYVQAAAIQGNANAVFGVPNKNSEELVIDAVRCALCAGDHEAADTYLNSAVRNSKNPQILSYVKLYEQWSLLCKAKKETDISESVAMLKTYSTLDSMKNVRPSLLLTLWHLTGEASYAENLKKNYPKSMEGAIVKGEIQTLPTPFWYFVPRNGVDLPEISNENLPAVSASETVDAKKSVSSKISKEKIVHLQLGLFREEANAKALAERVKARGFSAKVTTEVRPSGTKYYIVIVDENSKGTMGEELRTAGFECYPVFE